MPTSREVTLCSQPLFQAFLTLSTLPLGSLNQATRTGVDYRVFNLQYCLGVVYSTAFESDAVAQIEFLEWTEGEKSASDYTRSSSTT
jgi:hypothetical protein